MTTSKIISKSNKKKYNWNTTLVERLALSYGVSTTYVRQSLSGDRTSPTSETIKKDYKKVQRKIDIILDSVYKLKNTGIA